MTIEEARIKILQERLRVAEKALIDIRDMDGNAMVDPRNTMQERRDAGYHLVLKAKQVAQLGLLPGFQLTTSEERPEHMCQVCNRNTSGTERIRLKRDGRFVASMHAECAFGVSWTEEVIAESVPDTPQGNAETYIKEFTVRVSFVKPNEYRVYCHEWDKTIWVQPAKVVETTTSFFTQMMEHNDEVTRLAEEQGEG